jgi:multidrug efflux pump subunit AcrA (membrane-fusion protein)
MKVGDATEISRRNFPGRANAAKEVELSFRVNGPLITFPASVGDKVAQGDVLARIDPRDFEVQQRNVEGNCNARKPIANDQKMNTTALSEFRKRTRSSSVR